MKISITKPSPRMINLAAEELREALLKNVSETLTKAAFALKELKPGEERTFTSEPMTITVSRDPGPAEENLTAKVTTCAHT